MNRSAKFVIYAPSYDENSGGCIALHKLCSIINKSGGLAFIFPEIIPNGESKTFIYSRGIQQFDSLVARNFRINEALETPVLSGAAINEIGLDESVITIYPEVTFGNPLNGKKVVRWLLHDLGFHTGKIYVETGDLLVRYNAFRGVVSIPGCRTSPRFLRVAHIPFEKYNLTGASLDRSGVAYCVRKGKGKPFIHPDDYAIKIDGLSHEEISEIFKRVAKFYSYDTATLYSRLAVLCGCESIVVPDPGVELDEWCADPELRFGIQYGDTQQGPPSLQTVREVEARLKRVEVDSAGQVEAFVREAVEHFFA